MDIETNKTADEGHRTRPKSGPFFGRGLLTRGSPGDSWESGVIMAPRGLGAAFADKDPERGPFFRCVYSAALAARTNISGVVL